jgi:DNA-binding CsgD family transcriptional regulator/tetratricopeptide (TPR) repeat protein
LGRVTSDTIVGRDEPLRLLDDVLAAAQDRRPRLVLLAGEAGVGKTRLALELERHARERAFLVLHGESVEFGGEEFPYAPLVAALRDLPDAWLDDALEELDEEAREELAALLPRRSLTRSGPGRFSSRYGQGRLCELVLDLLGRLAGEQAPLLVVLEDLHWADRSSRDFVAFLAHSLRKERIAFALTYRTGELPRDHPLRRLLTELARRPVVVRVELAPLDRDDVARQLEAIAGGPVPARVADAMHTRSGGNPFFVEELFAAHRDAAKRAPDSLGEAVLGRVARLPAPARALLPVLAAAGGRVEHAVLESVSPESGAALRDGVDAGLLAADEREAALRHGLIGEVVYGTLVPAERAELHRELARAMAASGAPAARLADQWHRAGALDDALAASVAAGLDAARVYAFLEARGHFERALELWDGARRHPEAIDHVDLLLRAAQAARFTGDRERAVELGRRALAEVDESRTPIRAAGVYERLGEYASWDDRSALECYGRALRLLPPEPLPERARLLAAEGHALMGLRRWREARERCQAALAAAVELDDETQAAAAGVTLGLVLAFLGEAGEGERRLRTALETAQRVGAGEVAARAYVHLGELLRLRGDHAEALDAMLRGERLAAHLGMRGSFGAFMYVNAADDLLRLGRWDEAEQRIEHAQRLELGVTAGAMHHTIAGHLHALRGEAGRSRADLERADDLANHGLPGEFVTPIHSARATLALVEGDPEEAARQVAAAFAAVGDDRDPLYTPALHWLGVRAEAERAEAARARRREPEPAAPAARADELLADLDRLIERHAAVPDARAHRAAAQAERSRLAGSPDPGLWEAAEGAWERLHEPHPAAYTKLRRAEALLEGGGDRSAAAALLGAAHATAVELGARPLREAVEALSRRARVRLAPDVERQPADDGDPLTPREIDVLRLLAEGLTNRQIAERLFVSEKTVGTHVAHIFEKLDVHTRAAASGRAHALGLVNVESA